MPFQLQIPRPLYEEMVAQARAELPNECCGLLAGRLESRQGDPGPEWIGRALKRYPLVNALASPKEYESDPRSMFEAVSDMRQRDIDVLAVYHSHPTTAPVPSRTDLERNYGTEVVNLIISLQNEEPQVRAWWLTDRDYREAEWMIV